MELLNVVTARSVWLFDPAEMNPTGKKITPYLFLWLQQTYGFEKIPSSATDTEENALVFSRGTFKTKEGVDIGVTLKLYNDGVIAESVSSTQYTDYFINQVIRLSSEEFALAYNPTMIRYKLYLSEVHFHSNKKLIGLNPKLSKFALKITDCLPEGIKRSYEVSGMQFGPGPAIPNLKLSPFQVERKIDTLPEEGKYFSRAPIETENHLRLLEEFESVFMT